MSTAQKMSLFYTVSALEEDEFKIVWKMLRGLTSDITEIDELSEEEASLYTEKIREMEHGDYITLDALKKSHTD